MKELHGDIVGGRPRFGVECVLWGARGEALARNLGKGDPVMVEGELRYQTWEKDGEKKSRHEIAVSNFHFLPSGSKAEERDDALPF